MKTFFAKLKAWIIGHKVVSIVIAFVLTVGIACSIILPIALKHEHEYATTYSTDATNHWYECECGEKKDSAVHQASAVYSSDETNHWKECSVCGYDLTIEAHNYNQEVATDDYLKTGATATTKAVYYKSCVCGKAGTETFEADKTTATLTNIVMSGKVYDGTAVVAPTFDKNSDGIVTIEYSVKDANAFTTTAPIDAGEYTVRVTVAETETHTGAVATQDFTIAKYAIKDLTLYSVYNGTEYHTIDLSSIAQGLTLDVDFGSKNVGATVDSATVKVNSQETTNYEIVMEGDHACSLNIEPKELNVNWTPNTFVFLYDGTAKVPTAELEGVYSDDYVALTYTLGDGDSNTDVGSFEYIASINDTNYILANDNATFRIISPEFSTNDNIPLGIPYFNINLAEGDYYIDSSMLSVDGPTNFELKFYYASDLEKTTPVFTVDSLTNCSINITNTMETSFYVEISYAGYSGSFVIKEDDHDNIDEYGFCSKGGEYTGVDYGNPTGYEEVVFTEAGRKFLRFDINNNYHYGIKLRTEDHANFTVKVYGMSSNGTLYEIELTETPTNSFVSSSDDHFYIVVEADGEGAVEVYLDEQDLT